MTHNKSNDSSPQTLQERRILPPTLPIGEEAAAADEEEEEEERAVGEGEATSSRPSSSRHMSVKQRECIFVELAVVAVATATAVPKSRGAG
jgi:hypothetical protein